MNQKTTEISSIISAKETLAEVGRNYPASGFHPSIILLEIYRGKTGKVIYPVYTKEAKALQWALDRLACCDLPGKEHVEEYFRSMYRRNFRPKTYASALTAIYTIS